MIFKSSYFYSDDYLQNRQSICISIYEMNYIIICCWWISVHGFTLKPRLHSCFRHWTCSMVLWIVNCVFSWVICERIKTRLQPVARILLCIHCTYIGLVVRIKHNYTKGLTSVRRELYVHTHRLVCVCVILNLNAKSSRPSRWLCVCVSWMRTLYSFHVTIHTLE